MTASPERTDGYDIYNEFDHNIALEIRLKTALENDLLCPFHYFGITEFIGSGDTKAAEHSLHNFNMLVADKRVEYIIDKIKDYGFSGDRVKGLIFVSRIDEANELSKKFNERGFRTAALTGENNNEKIRNKLIEKLTTNNNSANDIANILNKSSRTIQRAIATLKETNRIKRVGPDKGGHWEICK